MFTRVGRLSSRLPAFRGRTRAFLLLFDLLGLKDKHVSVDVRLERPVPFSARLDLHSWLQRLAFLTGGYEPDTVLFLKRLHDCRGAGGYCLDVGANVGLIAIPLALLVRRNSHVPAPCVVALEPVQDNCRVLRHNVAVNDLAAAIQVLQVAVGDVEKRVDIQIEGNLAEGEGTGTANILPDHSDHACVRQSLRLEILDKVLGEAVGGWCSVIKIDADGYDLKVLQGAGELLARERPVVYGEFSAHCLRWHGQSLASVVEFASARNYVVWKRMHPRWQFTSELGDDFKQDLLLVPREWVASFDWCLQRD